MENQIENVHGHAVHFLERLVRASGAAEELALRLYHDPQLLRAVLSNIRIPEQFDRTALSLHEENKGPYLVASREGRFITCLGRDMTVQNLHVIPHSQLLAHIRKTELTRERWELAETLVGKGHETAKLFERIVQKADDVTKEEFLAISAMQPVTAIYFFNALFDAAESYGNLYCILRARKKFGTKEAPFLRHLWNRFWSAGHFALLASMSGMRELEEFVTDVPIYLIELLTILISSGSIAMTARLLWFTGKLGPVFLPECKRMMFAPNSPEAWVLGCFGAAAIGIRHKKTKSQVKDAIMKSLNAPDKFPRSLIEMLHNAKTKEFFRGIFGAIESPDKTAEIFLNICKSDFFNTMGIRPVTMPEKYQWKSVDDIPNDLTTPFALSLNSSFLTKPALLPCLSLMLPMIALAEAEDFYFPNDFYQHYRLPWSPSESILLIQSEIEGHQANRPVTVKASPGRNDLCSCGSGKKYKKCCMI